MSDAIALLVIMLWPIIPLWWIPVHGTNRLVKKLGLVVYPIILILWVIIAYFIYINRTHLLGYRIDFSLFMRTAGMLCVVAGIFLQLWALKALTTRVITGVPEIFNGSKTTLVIHGPFSHVRHPTYVSHTIVFIGIFLWTGIVATGFVGILDFIVVCLIIIPMEENELLHRFGDDYRAYMARTRRFIPRLREQVPTEKEANQADTGNSSKLA